MFLKIINLIIVFFVTLTTFFSQTTIWSEDFSSYANGVTTGADNNTANPALDWTSGGCTTCPSSADDYWEVKSGVFEAQDVNGETVFLETEVIDITNGLGVEFNILVSEDGDLEGPYGGANVCADAANEDFVNVFYSVDGGPYVLVPNYLGWCGLYESCASHTFYGDDGDGTIDDDCRPTDDDWMSSSFKQSITDGSTSLQIKVECTNSAASERIRFDDFSVTKTGSLPVNLISFEAFLNEDNKVELNWNTASELNSSHFILQKSKDLINWISFKEQNSVGNSSVENKYTNFDYEPYLATSYYRLIQVDFDGESVVYPPKVIEVNENNNNEIFIENRDNAWNINHQDITQGIINIYSINGVLIDSYIVSDEKTIIDNTTLSKGIYVVELVNENIRFSKKTIKL